jgi:hypothetical protein
MALPARSGRHRPTKFRSNIMLKRVNAGLFEEVEGADIELAVKATNNGGTEDAIFDYGGTDPGRAVVDGHPGCRFTVKTGPLQFKAFVAFSPSAPASARYDLFQINAAGTLAPVGKSVTNIGGSATSLIGFGIAGVARDEAVAFARPRREAATPSSRKKASRTVKRKSVSRKAKPTRARTTTPKRARGKRILKKER